MTDLTFLEQLAEEEKQFKKFSVAGTDRVQVAGNLRTGLAINIRPVDEDVTPTPPPPTGICCVGYDCSVTTEAECEGIWVEGFVCEEVKCCDPYFEVHVEVVTCGTEEDGSCIQTIDLTAFVNVPSVVAADGCCLDNLSGNGGATDVDGNSISLSVSSLGGGSVSWFVNVTPNCPTAYGAASMGGTESGDCDTGGTTVYPVNVVFGSGDCDGHLYTAVGTITVTWHG